MDLRETGKFIAILRKEHNFTQEQLGAKIGVTNKTISRWETGSYMVPADALLSMSEIFNVSVNEILSGRRLSTEEYQSMAEENLVKAIGQSSFTLKDRIIFYKHKWLKEHIAVMIFVGLCVFSVLIIGIVQKQIAMLFFSFILFIIAHAWRNNAMMTYVEKHAYDGNRNN